MPHGADSMNDSNRKPMGQTCQPHGYVCSLVTYDILSTPWMTHNLSGPGMNMSVIPVGATYCLPLGCFRVVSYVSYPWVTHSISS